MKEYKKVTKTYQTDEISKCICDKCGKECENIHHDTYDEDKRTLLKIQTYYAGDDGYIYLDLCPECTRKLLNWFPKNEEIEDFKDTLDIWENVDNE